MSYTPNIRIWTCTACDRYTTQGPDGPDARAAMDRHLSDHAPGTLARFVEWHPEWPATEPETVTVEQAAAMREADDHELRREALRIVLERGNPGTWDSHTAVAQASAIAAYLRDGTVPTDKDELADALYLVAAEINRQDTARPADDPGDPTYTAADLQAWAKRLDR